METIAKLGKLIDDRALESRDCVHIAIIPLVSGEDYLSAGCEIGLQYGTKDVAVHKDKVYGHDSIGIVDPFLDRPARKGLHRKTTDSNYFDCPFCGTPDCLQANGPYEHGEGFREIVACPSCGKVWNDIYTITDMIEEAPQ